MSLSRKVPLVVPSVLQSSRPFWPSLAGKYITPLTSVKVVHVGLLEHRRAGVDVLEDEGPGGRPIADPELFAVLVAASAVKISLPSKVG